MNCTLFDFCICENIIFITVLQSIFPIVYGLKQFFYFCLVFYLTKFAVLLNLIVSLLYQLLYVPNLRTTMCYVGKHIISHFFLVFAYFLTWSSKIHIKCISVNVENYWLIFSQMCKFSFLIIPSNVLEFLFQYKETAFIIRNSLYT